MAKPNEDILACMLSEDQINASLMLSLKENLLTGKLQACKAYQPEVCNSFTANTIVQGLFMFRKRLKGITAFA
ncbi:MAG: hypothetical protein RXR51_04785 [Nitrososphaeria archaeon]